MRITIGSKQTEVQWVMNTNLLIERKINVNFNIVLVGLEDINLNKAPQGLSYDSIKPIYSNRVKYIFNKKKDKQIGMQKLVTTGQSD
jgi:hypothetical protein